MINIIFPKEMRYQYKTYAFLINLNPILNKAESTVIHFSFQDTKIFATCHLAEMFYIIERLIGKDNTVNAVIADKIYYDMDILRGLYEHYAVEQKKFIEPHIVQFRTENSRSSRWLIHLKELQLREFDKIKVLISELLANIKMHTSRKEGVLSGYIDTYYDFLYVSIVNYDLSIAGNILETQGKEFASDFEAVMWALKKSNTTRDSSESGGLGLYLLRKYIHELQAQCVIISGKCFLHLDGQCYNEEEESNIIYKSYRELPNFFEGNIITILFPYLRNNEEDSDGENRGINYISLGEV